MADPSLIPAPYLRTPAAGRFLGLSGRTLEKHRTYGTGPSYRKIGGVVVYSVSDLESWADRGRQSSTSDSRRGGLRPARPVDEAARRA
jgi:predicted DNA-binding transcriptional regulator AlpA